MLYGLMGPIHVNGNLYNNVMAPLGGTLKDDELAAIATYIRGAWSNKAAPVGPEVFAAQRTKWGARGMFQIAELGEEK
jgi:mono/diheme cytochrome c family protein